MTVHELYASKKEQYQKYQVDLQVYTRYLEESKTKLMSVVSSLRSANANITDVGTRTCIDSLLDTITSSEDNLTDPEVLSGIRDRLMGISKTLENIIEEALRE